MAYNPVERMRAALIITLAAATAAAGVAPEQVRLALTLSTGVMNIHWATNNATTPADYTGVVQWGTTPGVWSSAAPAVSSSYTIWGYQSSYLHNAAMGGLAESTLYCYRVGSARDGWSPVFNFTTAPPAGTGSYPVKFIAYGDMGILHSQNTAALTSQMLRSGEVRAWGCGHGQDCVAHASSLRSLAHHARRPASTPHR